ncbi:hypothetical protein [Qipengyuania nanhaisediminis]|uniref:hypothetical protein n=1 Tax=Qipengyuania nanhaisediminis TaxID=604088 RepID=UPI0038B36DDF
MAFSLWAISLAMAFAIGWIVAPGSGPDAANGPLLGEAQHNDDAAGFFTLAVAPKIAPPQAAPKGTARTDGDEAEQTPGLAASRAQRPAFADIVPLNTAIQARSPAIRMAAPAPAPQPMLESGQVSVFDWPGARSPAGTPAEAHALTPPQDRFAAMPPLHEVRAEAEAIRGAVNVWQWPEFEAYRAQLMAGADQECRDVLAHFREAVRALDNIETDPLIAGRAPQTDLARRAHEERQLTLALPQRAAPVGENT